MSMHGYTAYIVRPIVQVGRPSGVPQSGCKKPRALDKAGYAALSRAAPLTPTDLAAILCGRYPSDPEPGDDPSIVEDERRILARIEEAIQHGELPTMPTLREGITWARKVGLPFIDVGPERVGAVEGDASPSPPARKRVSDFDPNLQVRAEEIARRLLDQHGKVPKKAIADILKKSLGLPQAGVTIERRLRDTWSPDRRERTT